MVTHQDYYQKIASLIADVPPQIVIVSMSHSFVSDHIVASGCENYKGGKKLNILEIFR